MGRRDAVGLANKNGQTLGTVESRIRALIASKADMELMNISAGSPVLEMDRLLYNKGNCPGSFLPP